MELSVTVGAVAGFFLIIALLLKMVPAVAVWEMVEAHQRRLEAPPRRLRHRPWAA